MPDAATAHPYRTPRRLLKRTLLLIALGIATTIFVASALSAIASHWSPDLITSRITVFERDQSVVQVFRAWPHRRPGVRVFSWSHDAPIPASLFDPPSPAPTVHEIDSGNVPSWSSIHDPRLRRASTELSSPITLHADWVAGWPLSALRGRLTPATLTDTQRIQLREGMLRFRGSTARIFIGDGLWLTGHLFPLIPMWPGFLINTVIYAAAWGGSLAIITRFRRAHRTRRGQCPACKYDLRNTPPGAPCPECGHRRS